MSKVQSGMGRFKLPFTCALIVAMIATAASAQVDSPEVGVPWLYKGLIVWAFFWAFLDAYTIGANDVANAFANAVGAGTLTHRGACLIACVFEFVGVVGLGKDVTDTIRKNVSTRGPLAIVAVGTTESRDALTTWCLRRQSLTWRLILQMVDVMLFKHDPYVLATGMSMVNVGSGLWVLAATLLGMPVSTTHSVVGAVLGIGISAFGWNGVKWQFKKGFLGVLASWFISPVFSGTLAAIFYMAVKYTVLLLPTKEAQLQRGLTLTPIWCFFAGGIIWGFMFIKGIPSLKKAKYELTIPLTFGLAFVHMALGAILAVPWLRRTIVDRENLPWWTMIMTPAVAVGSYGYRTEDEELKAAYGFGDEEAKAPAAAPMPVAPAQQAPDPYAYPAVGVMGSAFGAGQDAIGSMVPALAADSGIGAKREEDAAMHAVAYTVDDSVEELFKFLQLCSCCMFSMSHGANDVANAVGPFAAVWGIYSTGVVDKKQEVPIWVLVYGGIALDIGLLTLGHIIMSALGNRLTLQSPSRGSCIELGAMLTVMIASRNGIPVSTTHCISGATMAVGLCNGTVNALNWKLIAIIFGGWIITCPSAAFITGMMFWGIVTAPRPLEGNGFFQGSKPE